jgi:hypothetical protein
MAMMFVVTLGSLPSFALMFGDFLRSLGEETGAISLVTSCFYSALSFSGTSGWLLSMPPKNN